MKKLRYLVLVAFVFLVAACYEVNEEIVIDKNGSGTYVTKMDMGSLFEMMKSMGGEEELTKNGLDRAIDTTIDMETILDSAKELTADQRRILGTGTMKFQMNLDESVMKADVKFPFKSLSDLQVLMSGAAGGGLGDIMSKMFNHNDSGQPAAPSQDGGLDQVNNLFDVTVNNKKIAKQLNRPRYDSLMARPEFTQIKQMMGSGFEILYTTSIKLPRAVKKVDNSMITLSDDKKTATIKYDLLKMLETPEKFSYSIEY